MADSAFSGQVTNLEALIMHDNMIGSLGNMFVRQFASLQRMYIQNNRIKTLSTLSFGGLSQVIYYDNLNVILV